MSVQQPALKMQAWIDGIGFIAPGMPDWAVARAVLRGEQPYVAAPSVLPVPTLLPSAERRRASRVIKLSLALAGKPWPMPGQMPPDLFSALRVPMATTATPCASNWPLTTGSSSHALSQFGAQRRRRIFGHCHTLHGAVEVVGAFSPGGAGLLDAMAQVADGRAAVAGGLSQPLFAKTGHPRSRRGPGAERTTQPQRQGRGLPVAHARSRRRHVRRVT